jgi:3-hydroxyacyl-CoA dehydrogenase/3-hydroxy-2-methylbutyryl-CoA dehydrogenase
MLSRTVAIVSGGSSGLGAATAKYLVRHGAKVVVADLGHQQAAFEKMASSDMAFAATDVTNADQVSSALDTAERVFGEPVNAAISCAGVCPAKKTLSRKKGSTDAFAHPLDVFANTLHVNVVGSFNLARLAAERMARREPDEKDGLRGCIINTASIAAYEGQMGQVAYAASKGAVVGMTLPMARDLASYGIRVMTIVSEDQNVLCLAEFTLCGSSLFCSTTSRRQDFFRHHCWMDFLKLSRMSLAHLFHAPLA